MTQYEYITNTQMNGYYAEVCRGMASAQYRPDLIIGLSRGGLDFGIKLSHWYQSSDFLPLTWQTRDGEIKDSQSLEHILPKYSGKNILVVDDICDSGQTLKLVDQVTQQSDCWVDFAVALHNADCDFEPTWWGRTIYRNIDTQWFVFPWEEWWLAN